MTFSPNPECVTLDYSNAYHHRNIWLLDRPSWSVQSGYLPSVWLSSKNIEPQISAEDAKIDVVHRDHTSFSIDTRRYWVRGDRFQIETTSAPWVEIFDITRQVFEDHLIHTPIHSFGVNRNIHFSLTDRAARMRLGRKLAPIGPWGDFGKEMDTPDPNLTGGLQKLVMRRQARIDTARLETNVTIEPSVRTPDPTTGVYMEVNAHHAILDLPDGHGSREAMDLLSARFDEVLEEAEAIIEHMTKVGVGQ